MNEPHAASHACVDRAPHDCPYISALATVDLARALTAALAAPVASLVEDLADAEVRTSELAHGSTSSLLPLAERLASARAAIDRIHRVTRLLRSSARWRECDMIPIDLENVVAEAALLASPRLDGGKVALRVDVEQATLVLGDVPRLTHTIFHLMVQAFEHTDPAWAPRTVDVSVVTDARQNPVVVIRSQRALDPRPDDAHAGELELILCRHSARLHGGDLVVTITAVEFRAELMLPEFVSWRDHRERPTARPLRPPPAT